MYAPVLIPVSGQSCQLESEKAIKWFLVLILACIKMGQLTMSHMFQDQLHNTVQKVSTMQHAVQEWL